MNDVQVTLVGTITSDIRFAHHGEVPVAKFRIRAQPRRFNKATNTWQDGEPSYYTAVAWRHLAEHVASSLGIGDPVLAHGRLRISRPRFGDDPTITAEVELVSVGHDLRWGTTVYRKSQPPPLMRRSAPRGPAGEEGAGVEGTDAALGAESVRAGAVASEAVDAEMAVSLTAESDPAAGFEPSRTADPGDKRPPFADAGVLVPTRASSEAAVPQAA